jgi:hypothetical protein
MRATNFSTMPASVTNIDAKAMEQRNKIFNTTTTTNELSERPLKQDYNSVDE